MTQPPSPPGAESPSLRLGVLFSGGGRTLLNLAEAIARGEVPAVIAVAVSSHREAAGVERARAAGVPTEVVDYRERRATFCADILALLDAARVDLVVLAGFIRKLEIPPRYRGRVVNIHPSLLPKYGGQGFYGDRVHRAVLEARERFSGCSVHFVSDEYDDGPIILQRVVPVRPDDDIHTLAARVFEEERIAYPEALRLLAQGRVIVQDGRARIVGARSDPVSPRNRP